MNFFHYKIYSVYSYRNSAASLKSISVRQIRDREKLVRVIEELPEIHCVCIGLWYTQNPRVWVVGIAEFLEQTLFMSR